MLSFVVICSGPSHRLWTWRGDGRAEVPRQEGDWGGERTPARAACSVTPWAAGCWGALGAVQGGCCCITLLQGGCPDTLQCASPRRERVTWSLCLQNISFGSACQKSSPGMLPRKARLVLRAGGGCRLNKELSTPLMGNPPATVLSRGAEGSQGHFLTLPDTLALADDHARGAAC